jgi:hypothetical protein
MHSIELEGCRETAEPVVTWFMKEYLPDAYFFLVVEEKDLSEEGVFGWCIRETQNEFLIQIHSGLGETYISILLHELHHMWQYYHDLPRDEEETLREELKLLNKYNQNH